MTFWADQARYRQATRWLVAGFLGFMLLLGLGADLLRWSPLWSLGRTRASTEVPRPRPIPPSPFGSQVPWGMLITSLTGLWMVWRARSQGVNDLLAAVEAEQLLLSTDPDDQRLLHVVEEMSVAAGQPVPTVYLIETPGLNAFVVGTGAGDHHLVVTRGLVATLPRDELQAVVAHEFGHLVNGDVLLMTHLVALVGAMALWQQIILRLLQGTRGGARSRGAGAGPWALPLLVLWTICWLLAPTILTLLRLAVSRRREFLADAMSAQFTRNPGALARALDRLDAAATQCPLPPLHPAAALCIMAPVPSRWNNQDGPLADLLATHPPLRERVRRLRALTAGTRT